MDELLLYLFGFWRFVFSVRFRTDYMSSFRRMSLARKMLEAIGAATATFVGIGASVLFVSLMVLDFGVNSRIDACLDNGGSFDYQECACDYKVSHSVIDEHQCK